MEISEQLLEGLKARKAELREYERRLLKASGLEESIAKAQVELDELKKKEAEIKAEHEKFGQEKNRAVAGIKGYFEKHMAEIAQPVGEPKLDVTEDGSLFIGVVRGNQVIQGEALSGGERVIFDAALAYAMTRDSDGYQVLVIEGAEADHERIGHLISAFTKVAPEAQVIVNSWVGYQDVMDIDHDTPADFSDKGLLVVDLGGKDAEEKA